MPPAIDLPPPPEHPTLPPETFIPGEQALEIPTADGQKLQALGLFPPGMRRVVVLCHPHPLYGGTMHNAIVVSVAKEIARVGQDRVGMIRFNFRGVGASTGRHAEGRAEREDVLGALAEARRRAPELPLGLVGYSFGAGVCLRVLRDGTDADRVALIAPAVRLFRADADGATVPPAVRVQVVAAERDQFSDLPDVAHLARSLGAAFEVIAEADHFFVRYRRSVAALVAPFVAPEAYD